MKVINTNTMTNRINTLSSLVFFSFFLFPPATCSSTNQTDLLSLLAIKSSLQDPLGALNSWNQTLHFCRWTGIRCDGRLDRVVAINLSSQGLVGNLSPHIGNLSFLENVTLINNTFRGQIPSQMTLLRRLQVVDFRLNEFDGPIPTNLSRCLDLVELRFTKNWLSGPIPPELGRLPRLSALSLAVNRLSGTIPPSVGNITTLTTLSLLSNGFAGEIPESFSRLRRLELLQLAGNKLTGTIPRGIFNLSEMTYFDVSVNRFHGVLPSTLGLTLPNLSCLVLEQNQFTGKIPASISNASLIEWIVLSSNRFTGPIPDLSRLTLVEDFFLRSNLIVDDTSFISSLTNSTKLARLDVGDNMLWGSIPESIANMSVHLNLMTMDSNNIHGSIPFSIGSVASLSFVNLSHNVLDGSLPTSLSKLSRLHTLILGGNGLRGELPASLGNLTLLSVLRVDGNKISGNVPSKLGNCTNLLELDLSDNNFSGLIPPEIMRLQSLSIAFNLSHNGFEGSIPYEVGSLTKLGALDLSCNRLSKRIPNSITNCASLETLYLNENLLEGEVPAALSGLMGLLDLDLSRNNLSGVIPPSLGNMKLERLNLSFNGLRGEVPRRGVFRSAALVSLGGNQGLCGGVSGLNLPPCPGVESSKIDLPTLMKNLILVLVTGVFFMVILVFYYFNRTKIIVGKGTWSDDGNGIQFMRLSYADLARATRGFSEDNTVGSGRYGSVYRGLLDDDATLVAIKVVNLAVRGASKTFTAECKALGGIRHRNLVRLLSVCDGVDFQGNNFKALVYEYKMNGSLEKWLHGEKSGRDFRNLSIMERLNIAIDIARGIEYLHFGSGSCFIHGDLKPSNILLDQKMVACVGDFGSAKIAYNILPSYDTNSSSIGIKGTIGYVPPEYGSFGVVSTQGDVYSFGIILLEMFTNKRPTDDSFDDRLNLHSFVSTALPDRAMEIVDPEFKTKPDLNGEKLKKCMIWILSVGVSCSKEIPYDRMPINTAANKLSDIKELFFS